jgi:hypothetical protein
MGTGFVNGASVIIGTGTARNVNLSLGAVHFISSTEVQVSVSAFPGATSETDDVSVKNPDSGVGTLAGSYLIDVVAPVVSLTAPSDGSSGVGTTPTFSGAAGEVAASSSSSADAPTITVYICSGTQTTCDANSAFLVQTLTTTESAGSWSVAPSTPLDASSSYTAEASQSDDAGNAGFSSATTFST